MAKVSLMLVAQALRLQVFVGLWQAQTLVLVSFVALLTDEFTIFTSYAKAARLRE